jgi:phosphohistidine phosphatase
MQLYIMRHGEASMNASTDAHRPLTELGRLEAEMMGKWFEHLSLDFAQILVSPYLRAQQTLSTVLSEMHIMQFPPFVGIDNITTVDLITPSAHAQDVHDYLDAFLLEKPCETLLIVTHMPLVSFLVESLTFKDQMPIFQTAAVAQIDYDIETMKGTLVRLISPHDVMAIR